jgi:2-keto-4-pentenoate hydratase/2-oxohepta-3-ene-1,7-dioic acid hydratase in catechol pathway
MKLISFRTGEHTSYGALVDGKVADFGMIAGSQTPDLRAAIAQGRLADLSERARPEAPLSSVELLPALPNPGKVFCVGHNYEAHRQETGRERVGHPSIFTRFADTLIAHGAPIIRPRVSTQLDFEGELAVVIGKGGRAISEADAMDHVAGFACANDASVRDWQRHTTQFTPGKNFPGTAPLGPWLVTPEEIADLDAVNLTTRLNGQTVQQATLTDMIFPIPVIIAYLSAFTLLSPGDLILTGTPGGVGARREPPLWMKPGDIVEVEISGIGHLVNPIADEV